MSHFTDAIMMVHVAFGLLVILTGLWVFVDTLNVGEQNVARIRTLSRVVAALMWLAFLVGGYWYVFDYTPDKTHILKGPWPFAHNFFMETKEHVIFILLLLTTFLPIAASSDLVKNRGNRNLVLWVAALIVLIGISMDGSGAIIGVGAKLACAMP